MSEESSIKKQFYENNPMYVDDSFDRSLWKLSKPEDLEVDGSVLLKGEQELEKSPSILSYLVIRNGTIVWEKYFNESKVNYSYNIHSASKGILSALVGIALKQGFIESLDEEIYRLLPKYSYKDKDTKKITLRHLLSMTAGFEWDEDVTESKIEKKKDWIQAILDLPLNTNPGESFKYCTGQSHVISAILTEKTGMTTFAFAKKYLLEQIGITVEHWGSDPQGIFSGGYNVYMTARELGQFALLYLNKGLLDGTSVISEDWVRQSLTRYNKVDSTYWYGYHWWILSFNDLEVYKLWGHGGQFGYIIPKLDIVVILTADTNQEIKELNGDQFVSRYIIPAVIK